MSDFKELNDINVKFDQPRGGYWDGGAKSGGVFEPTIEVGGFEERPDAAYTIKWGCWGLNFWFRQAAPKDFDPLTGSGYKRALANAVRKIKAQLRVPAQVVVVETKEDFYAALTK